MDTSMLPKPGEPLILPDGATVEVAWCSGWVWPYPWSEYPEPTRLYAQALDRASGLLLGELRVIAGRDAQGSRFWMAERRAG